MPSRSGDEDLDAAFDRGVIVSILVNEPARPLTAEALGPVTESGSTSCAEGPPTERPRMRSNSGPT